MRLLRGLENGLQRDDLAEAGVARPGDPGDRIELLGLDLAADEQLIPDVKREHFADDQAAARVTEFEALPEAAFHRDRSGRHTRHRNAVARHRLQAEDVDLADLRRM